jgi:hypothetical protein
MKRFNFGLLAGFLLGVTTSGIAAVVTGDDGYLKDWRVTKDGEDLCSALYVWHTIQVIECK